MPTRLTAAAIVLLAAGAAHAAQGLPAEKDEVLLKSGQKRQCWILDETPDALVYVMAPTAQKQTVPLRDVKSWTYSEMMKPGYWTAAVEERDRGRLEDAADRFGQVATNAGGRRWMLFYGRFNEGLCLGLAGKHAAAAEAFAALNKEGDVYKAHRLWLDGRFQEGYSHALAKQAEPALKVADELIDFGRKKPLPTAEWRGAAIKAVLYAVQGDLGKAEQEFPKVKTNAADEPEFWFQFNLFFADKQREGGRAKEAEVKYRNLLMRDFVERDPAKKCQVALGLGLCLVQTDKASALIELLKLDALPYGSPDQKCEARFNAARIMAEELEEGRKVESKDKARVDYLKALERSVRLLLVAAAESTSTIPARDQAKGMLESLGPDPDAAPPAAAAPATSSQTPEERAAAAAAEAAAAESAPPAATRPTPTSGRPAGGNKRK